MVDSLDDVLNSSHNPLLLKEAHTLMCRVSADPRFPHRENMKGTLADILEECGVPGIWNATNFRASKEVEKQCAALTDELIKVGFTQPPAAFLLRLRLPAPGLWCDT